MSVYIYNFLLINFPLLHNLVSFSWRVVEFKPPLLVSFLARREGKTIYGQLLEQTLLNARTHGTFWLASLLDGGVASSSMNIPLYIFRPLLLHFSYFIFVDSWERARRFPSVILFTPLLMLLPLLLKSSLAQGDIMVSSLFPLPYTYIYIYIL